MTTPEYKPYRFLIAGFILFFNIFYGINFGLAGPLLPLIMDQHDIGRGPAGLLVSVVMFTHAAFLIPAAMLCSRRSAKFVFGLGWVLSGATVFTFLVDSFSFVVTLRAIFGVALCMVFPATARIMMGRFKATEMPIITSLNVTAFTLGFGLGTFIAIPITLSLGWENTFSIFGGILLIGGLAWALMVKLPDDDTTATNVLTVKEMIRVARYKITLLVGLADGVILAQFFALTAWLPTYYYQEFGMSLAKAGFIVGLIPFIGFFATLLGGFLGSKGIPRRPIYMTSGVVAGLAGFASFTLNNEVLIYIAMVALGFSSFLYLPTILTLPMELKGSTAGNVAVSWAVMFSISSVFAVVSPITVGFMADSTGSYVPGFILWTVVAISFVVIGYLLPETGLRARSVRGPRLSN